MKINEILELKPCPFCGSEVEIDRLDMDQGGVKLIEIRCRCGAELRFESDDYIYDLTDTPHQMGLTAIEKFNKRVTNGDAISRCELFNRLATIPAPPEANDFKAEVYKIIQQMETVDAVAEPTVIRSRTLMPTKDFKEWAKRIRETNSNAVVIPCDAEAVSADTVEWIPCSERLPKEEKKTYWVCTDTEYQCECRWTNNRFGIGEGEWGWSIFDTPQYSKPIAWMPLPKPYKGGDAE